MLVATTPPTTTVAPDVKLVPLSVMFVPPVVLPCVGEIELRVTLDEGGVGLVGDLPPHALAPTRYATSRTR